MIFSHDYAVVYPGLVGLFASAATTGGRYVLQDNGTASTDYQGTAYRWEGSNTSSAMTLDLSGSNTACTYSGRIRNNEGTAAGSLLLRKSGTGTWTLTNDNDFTGGISVGAGTLRLRHGNALGTTGSVSQTAGSTIDIAGGITLNKSGVPFTLDSGASTTALNVPDSGGDNTIQCTSVTLNSQLIVNVGTNAALRFRNTQAIQRQGTEVNGFTKNGKGELDLGSFANTYTGPVTSNAGTLTVGASCAPSTNGPLGNASSTVTVRGAFPVTFDDSGTFKYNGTGAAIISRALQFTGATSNSAARLTASGTGAVTINNATFSADISYIYLDGENTGDNTLASNVPSLLSVLFKRGFCKWVLSGSSLHSGQYLVQLGTLTLGNVVRNLGSGYITMVGGTLSNGSASVTCASVRFQGSSLPEYRAVVRAVLAGTTQVRFETTTSDHYGTLYPDAANGSNTYTGDTTISAGDTLTLYTDANPRTEGHGKVTGDGNVSVTGNLAVRAATQNGCARYGGNLTFNAGSKLRIGVAA